MAEAPAVDLRERVVCAVEAGMSRRAEAERFGVGFSSAIRYVQRSRKRGGNLRSQRTDGHGDVILVLVEAKPDLILAEIGERLHEAYGYRLLPSLVHRFFPRHGITGEKRPRTPPSKTG